LVYLYVLAGYFFHNQLGQAMALLNQLGFSALLLAMALVAGYIAFKYARRRKRVGTKSRQENTENQKAGTVAEDARGITGGANHSAAGFLAESLNTLELQNVALAVTGSPAQHVTNTGTPFRDLHG
jgi:uncharacterized membrane protein YfcA